MAPDSAALSFEEYVGARGHALLRFSYLLTGDRHLSEDLTQEALARAHRRWSRIAVLDRPDAYVRRIIVNDFLSWKRRRASHLVLVADPADHEPTHGHRKDPGDFHADRDQMWQLLAQLPRQQRAVLVLRYYEDWTDQEIGDQLDCSPATVRSHASKGLARLRGSTSPSTILNGAT